MNKKTNLTILLIVAFIGAIALFIIPFGKGPGIKSYVKQEHVLLQTIEGDVGSWGGNPSTNYKSIYAYKGGVCTYDPHDEGTFKIDYCECSQGTCTCHIFCVENAPTSYCNKDSDCVSSSTGQDTTFPYRCVNHACEPKT
ncbi:MAG TPA: hypothetical protein ENG68_01955, partial [bacterium]|nr:hypothetical protein [bacterium]